MDGDQQHGREGFVADQTYRSRGGQAVVVELDAGAQAADLLGNARLAGVDVILHGAVHGDAHLGTGVAAQHRAVVHQHHLCAMTGSSHSGAEAGHTAADDADVNLMKFFVVERVHSNLLNWQ